MHYDPNYRNQIFYDSTNSLSMEGIIGLFRQEMSTRQLKTPMPKSKLSKIVLLSLLGFTLLSLIVAAIAWICTKSPAYVIVLFVISAVYTVGFMAVISAIAIGILRKACTDPVDAVCIGYSISGNGSGQGNHGGISKSPVFQYEYQGFKWTAFDGLYDNFSHGPAVMQKTKILVNPSDPEDILWNFKKNREVFLVIAGIFGIVFCTAMLLVVHNDDNFMNSVIPKRAAAVEAQKQKEENPDSGNSGSENASAEEEYVVKTSDDGRIIIDDGYIRNEVWPSFADSEYVIKARKVTEIEVLNDGEDYVVYFEEDPDFSESEWFFSGKYVTDEIRNTKPGDKFYFAQLKDLGYCNIFSVKEYVLETAG